MSVAEYIREVKLQRAHDLLTENKVKTISEAAVKVGFKSISHFSNCIEKNLRRPNSSIFRNKN